MHAAFLDLLTSQDALKTVSRGRYLESIREYLQSMLNAHQGFCPHEGDYGLPDMMQLYQALPAQAKNITELVKRAVVSFEPRCQVISAVPENFIPADAHFKVTLKTLLRADRSEVIFQVLVSSQGICTVKIVSGK